ncbi:hypothetical protein HanPI659440_Chr03g0110671 [Helianthus annuus]|nr:hypothetical protein HanPI659440_Chr03g0110671 [Helianthus annuus]
MSTSGDVESTSSSLPGSAAGSPRSKVKFLCSHGGKILPRPADGHLKYVGGETRVVSVPRTITFTGIILYYNIILSHNFITKNCLQFQELFIKFGSYFLHSSLLAFSLKENLKINLY